MFIWLNCCFAWHACADSMTSNCCHAVRIVAVV